MGTEIRLTVGHVSLSYAKNHMGIDFGSLFQVDDETRRPSEEVNYEYYEQHPEKMDDLNEIEAAFVRPLKRVLPRLNLLGHSLESARDEYETAIAEAAGYADVVATRPDYLTFEEFCALAGMFPLSSLTSTYIDYDTPDRDRLAQGRFADHIDLFARLPWTGNANMYWSEASFLSARLCILSAPSMLQVFALNDANLDTEIMWQFGPIVDAGWVDREAFVAGARRTQTVLVATEGSSDARILRRAFDLLRPDVADFLRFLDSNERHHFWGTGNLVRFAEGLLRIDIQNQVLFLLDNDAEGVEACRRLEKLDLTTNMRFMRLPDLEELRSFPALGPEGVSESDINGRAAAIECYLDLRLKHFPPARVIWSNYKKEIDAWHGALEHKDTYFDHFMKQDAASLLDNSYDTSKLVRMLDAIIHEATHLLALDEIVE